MPINEMLVSQGEGFIRRYFELDIEEGRPGAERALEWWAVIEKEIARNRIAIRDLENRISQSKLLLG